MVQKVLPSVSQYITERFNFVPQKKESLSDVINQFKEILLAQNNQFEVINKTEQQRQQEAKEAEEYEEFYWSEIKPGEKRLFEEGTEGAEIETQAQSSKTPQEESKEESKAGQKLSESPPSVQESSRIKEYSKPYNATKISGQT